ncbi:hypothetical protein [Tuwongella immobilis]|uniref:Uncharacterized protein n=1 Tax=Tuwongella immobilis TaxID=692036 RepID=A0A6C2YJL5_9BACT|nr:hypothetical protein [Tuwongella immobilis]VIP01303.1 unnamed protein product [Tuwongella immobilis]VTR98032.1 unnamed protein product [Tuwongella immobilis]
MSKLQAVSISSMQPNGLKREESLKIRTLEDLHEQFDLLDGGPTTRLTLVAQDERILTIEGHRNRYYVSAFGPRFGPFDLSTLSKDDEMDIIVLQGIETHLPSRFIVDVVKAKLAIDYFYNHGDIHPDLFWE